MYLPSPPSPPTFHSQSLTPSSPLLPRSTNENPICGFPGNPDVYGIGIRLGIYAQILAVYIANYFLLSEARLLRDAISIFVLALLAVSLIYASNPSSIHAVEGFILLQILAWSCMMGVRARSSYTHGVFSRGSLLRKVIGDVMNLVMVCLQVWFWWKGLGQMKRTPCGTWLMMYVVKTDLSGWARRVMMGLSVFVLVCTVYWVGVEFSRMGSLWRVKRAREEFSVAVRQWVELKIAGTRSNVQEEAVLEDDCAVVTGDADSSIPLDRTPETRNTGTATLSPSPSISSQEPPSCDLTPPSPNLTNPTKILPAVYQGELYIQHCISATPYQANPDGKPLPFTTIARSILSSKTQASPSWIQCYLRTWTALITLSFPARAFAVYAHLRQAHLMDPLNGTFQMYAAITYTSPSSSTNQNHASTWQDVTLASELLLDAPDMPKKVWLGWYYAILDLVIHIIVILQLELTLYWNHVSGLQVLWSNVGQLIPFIVGVGGLGLVLARWAEKWWKKRGQNQDAMRMEEIMETKTRAQESGEMCGLDKDVRDGYARWKEKYTAAQV